MPAGKRKPRNKVLPTPPTGVETPYANCRPEWQGVGLGEKTKIILSSDAWQAVMIPALDQLDAERPRKGPAPSYTSAELESAVLYQKLAGVPTYGEARSLLAGDREADTRQLLGFDKPRRRVGRAIRLVKSLDGVPCETTIWKHLQRWKLDRHIEAYEALFALLVEEHLSDPEFQQEARTLNIDGSTVRSHYTSWERVDKKTGEVRPATLHGGGYMPRTESNRGSDGHGFTMVAVSTSTGLPLSLRLVPLATKDQSEPDTAIRMFREDWEHLRSFLDPGITVLTGDAAFKKQALRAEVRKHGIIENVHAVSHGTGETNKRNQSQADARVFQIQGYPDWVANGHRELSCRCGDGKTIRRFSQDKNGRAVARTEGECKNCGSITITSGKWRVAHSPRRFVRCLLGEEHEADFSFGNPLTFHDKTAKTFGRNRFGHGEGFHGHLQTRFGLLKHKAWYSRREQAELDFLMVFSAMHALAIEQRSRARAQAPPGLAIAA